MDFSVKLITIIVLSPLTNLSTAKLLRGMFFLSATLSYETKPTSIGPTSLAVHRYKTANRTRNSMHLILPIFCSSFSSPLSLWKSPSALSASRCDEAVHSAYCLESPSPAFLASSYPAACPHITPPWIADLLNLSQILPQETLIVGTWRRAPRTRPRLDLLSTLLRRHHQSMDQRNARRSLSYHRSLLDQP